MRRGFHQPAISSLRHRKIPINAAIHELDFQDPAQPIKTHRLQTRGGYRSPLHGYTIHQRPQFFQSQNTSRPIAKSETATLMRCAPTRNEALSETETRNLLRLSKLRLF